LIPLIQTARLILRAPLPGDAGPLAAFLTGPRASWIGGPYATEAADEWLDYEHERWATLGWGSWIVTLPDNTPIGRVGLLDHDGWPEPELAWFLFDGYEGQGYAHEATLAARAHANGPLGLPPLFSFVEPANVRSRALAERLGATHERDTTFQDIAFQIYRHPLGHLT
jgi:RimJ/RimL family protein N-acetyltransferase